MGRLNPDQVALHRFIETRPAEGLELTANPMAQALGTRIMRVDTGAGEVELAFAPHELFVQGAGVLQGGAVGAMLDFAMAFAVLAALPGGHSCATANLNVAFVRTAPQGRYRAIGQIERQGRQLAFTRARLFPDGGPEQWVASASSTLAIF